MSCERTECKTYICLPLCQLLNQKSNQKFMVCIQSDQLKEKNKLATVTPPKKVKSQFLVKVWTLQPSKSGSPNSCSFLHNLSTTDKYSSQMRAPRSYTYIHNTCSVTKYCGQAVCFYKKTQPEFPFYTLSSFLSHQALPISHNKSTVES